MLQTLQVFAFMESNKLLQSLELWRSYYQSVKPTFQPNFNAFYSIAFLALAMASFTMPNLTDENKINLES